MHDRHVATVVGRQPNAQMRVVARPTILKKQLIPARPPSPSRALRMTCHGRREGIFDTDEGKANDLDLQLDLGLELN
jgi:hypothetical protein